MISTNFGFNSLNKIEDGPDYKDALISEMKKEIAELRKNQKEIETLSGTLAELEARCNRYERERIEIEKNYEHCFFEQNDLIKKLKESNSKLKNENQRLRLKNRWKRSEIEVDILRPKIDKKLNEVIKINCMLEDEIRSLRDKNLKLKKEVVDLKKTVVNSKGVNDKLNYENTRLKNKEDNMKKMNFQLKGKIKNYQSSNYISTKKFEEYLESIRRKEEEIHMIRSKMGKVKQSNDDHIEQNKNLVKLVEQLMKEIENFNREDKLASRMLNRKETIEKIKEDYNSSTRTTLKTRKII